MCKAEKNKIKSTKSNANFQLISDFKPSGDQPQAIATLLSGLKKGYDFQTLKGVTGSGKTYTMAQIIADFGKPTLVLAHNKTLVGQLYAEFKKFFPNNAVEYFVSYYNYYQPEAYLPSTDTYIEKDSSINDEIDRLRHRATASLLERKDVIVVASVSCIYGLGNPDNYAKMLLHLRQGQEFGRDRLISELVRLQYERDDIFLTRGKFRIRGENIEIFPVSFQNTYIRVQFFDEEIEAITEVDAYNHKKLAQRSYQCIFPANHYATSDEKLDKALTSIEKELIERLAYFQKEGKELEAYRLEQKTRYDMSMIRETGFTKGIENYSRFLDERMPGEPPFTLLDFFPQDFLLIIDESHLTIPQIGAMYAGDFARKTSLIDYGFRLPAAYDNRPLNFSEFEQKIGQTLLVSATPGDYELSHQKALVEQIIRPTGLLDPTIEICPTEGQIDVLIERLKMVIARDERAIILTLTKEMAEEFTTFLQKEGFKVCYIHVDVPTQERLLLLKKLRSGIYDIIVGINLLREGIDLPEVSLLAIMDANIEGIYRSFRSLIQMIGRAARNVNGHVIMFADSVSSAMYQAIEETNRRRTIQAKYNEEHKIIPRTIKKEIENLPSTLVATDEIEDELNDKSFNLHQKLIDEITDLDALDYFCDETENPASKKKKKNMRTKEKERTFVEKVKVDFDIEKASRDLILAKAMKIKEKMLVAAEKMDFLLAAELKEIHDKLLEKLEDKSSN